MTSDVRRARWVAGLVVALVATGGPGWAQRSTAAPPAPASPVPAVSLPPGDGAAELRAALAGLPDVGAEDQTIVSFVDHAAVRAGGASAHAWFGRRVAIGVAYFDLPSDAEALEAATGLALAEVATTLVVDASVPSFLTLVRGGVDAGRLDAALAARGYAAVEDDRARRWCGPNGCDGGMRLNLANRDASFALFGGVFGRSYPAVLTGDLLAVGPVVAALDATLATAAGLAPSLLDRPEVAALVEALDVDAVVRQAWLPVGTLVASVAPPGARSILFADARRGGDEWLLIVVAFEVPADADAFAAGALDALGLAGGAEPAPGTLQASLRAHAADAVVDRVAPGGLQVVRIVVARPFPDGVGTQQDRPAELLWAMVLGALRFELPWAVR